MRFLRVAIITISVLLSGILGLILTEQSDAYLLEFDEELTSEDYLERGNQLLALGEYSSALTEFDIALVLDPQNADAYYPAYYEYDIDDPACVPALTISWLVVEINAYADYPLSDGDGNSGHSWYSIDGGSTWDFAFSVLVDMVWSAWADECVSESVTSTSLGCVKALFN